MVPFIEEPFFRSVDETALELWYDLHDNSNGEALKLISSFKLFLVENWHHCQHVSINSKGDLGMRMLKSCDIGMSGHKI